MKNRHVCQNSARKIINPIYGFESLQFNQLLT